MTRSKKGGQMSRAKNSGSKKEGAGRRIPFSYLLGDPKKEFSLQIVPDLLQSITRTRKTQTEGPKETVTDEEFLRRYQAARRSVFVLAGFFVFCVFHAIRAQAFLYELSAVCAAILVVVFVLSHNYRLWVARQVLGAKSGGSPLQPHYRFGDYMRACMTSPLNLLPLAPPER